MPARETMASPKGSALLTRPNELLRCGAEGIRTPDPLDANEVRYRTAPQPLGTPVRLPVTCSALTIEDLVQLPIVVEDPEALLRGVQAL